MKISRRYNKDVLRTGRVVGAAVQEVAKKVRRNDGNNEEEDYEGDSQNRVG
ncbi:MAG: hypothetical protein ABR988_15690 [Terriglobales bacterium]|jgi:hypothetical protein